MVQRRADDREKEDEKWEAQDRVDEPGSWKTCRIGDFGRASEATPRALLGPMGSSERVAQLGPGEPAPSAQGSELWRYQEDTFRTPMKPEIVGARPQYPRRLLHGEQRQPERYSEEAQHARVVKQKRRQHEAVA